MGVSAAQIMTIPSDPIVPGPAAPVAHGGAVGRTVGFIVGLSILLIAGIFSLGIALLAPVGMLVGAYLWRRRGRRLPVVGHWLAALCGAAFVIIAYATLAGALVPTSTWSKMKQSMDSASAHPAPPPKWVDRIYPGMAERAAQRQASSPKLQAVSLAYGAGFAAIFFVAIFGTFGWIGGMLLGFAVKGYWPGATT
jgi:hypothetical protein